MKSFEFIFLASVMSVPVIVFVVVLIYLREETKQGTEAARRALPANILKVVGLGGAIIVFIAVGRSAMDTILVFMHLFLASIPWILNARARRNRSEDAHVILDLGITYRVSSWRIVLGVLFGPLLLVVTVADPQQPLWFFTLGLFMLSWGVYYFIANRSKTIITDSGVYTGYASISWSQIKSFKWKETKGDTIRLIIEAHSRLPLLGSTWIPIPREQQDAVNTLLLQHTSLPE